MTERFTPQPGAKLPTDWSEQEHTIPGDFGERTANRTRRHFERRQFRHDS